MDLQIAQNDVARIAGGNAGRGPVTIRWRTLVTGRNFAFAPAAVAVILDATGAVGDVKTGHFHVRAAIQVHDHPGPLGPPQLRRLFATIRMALPQDSGGLVRRGAAGDRGHDAFPGPALATVAGTGCTVAHAVIARTNMERVATINSRRTERGQGHEGMAPRTSLVTAAARVGTVGKPGTLGGIAAIGTDVVIGCRSCGNANHEESACKHESGP